MLLRFLCAGRHQGRADGRTDGRTVGRSVSSDQTDYSELPGVDPGRPPVVLQMNKGAEQFNHDIIVMG